MPRGLQSIWCIITKQGVSNNLLTHSSIICIQTASGIIEQNFLGRILIHKLFWYFSLTTTVFQLYLKIFNYIWKWSNNYTNVPFWKLLHLYVTREGAAFGSREIHSDSRTFHLIYLTFHDPYKTQKKFWDFFKAIFEFKR